MTVFVKLFNSLNLYYFTGVRISLPRMQIIIVVGRSEFSVSTVPPEFLPVLTLLMSLDVFFIIPSPVLIIYPSPSLPYPLTSVLPFPASVPAPTAFPSHPFLNVIQLLYAFPLLFFPLFVPSVMFTVCYQVLLL